jgi:hypothetical protein
MQMISRQASTLADFLKNELVACVAEEIQGPLKLKGEFKKLFLVQRLMSPPRSIQLLYYILLSKSHLVSQSF